MLQTQLNDVLSCRTEEETGIADYGEAVYYMQRMEEAYREAEENLPSFLENIRNKIFIAPDTLRKTAVYISSIYSQSELLEAYGQKHMGGFIRDGAKFTDIYLELKKVKALEEKAGTLVRMGYVRFGDSDADKAYDGVRLGLKRIVETGAEREEEAGLFDRVELLETGLETKNQTQMVEIFQKLSGNFDARILSNILVKNFTFRDENRDVLLKGFGLEDEKFFAFVYDESGECGKYFSTGTGSVAEESPETEELSEEAFEKPRPETEEKDSGSETDIAGITDTTDSTEETDASRTDVEKEAVTEEAASVPPAETESLSVKAEDSAETAENNGAETKQNKDETADKKEKAKDRAKTGGITVIEGRAKKAFDDDTRKAPAMPEGFFVTEDSLENNTGNTMIENPAVARAYSMLDTEGGSDAAIACIGEEAEKDEELIFIEEQMMYAFGAENTEYSFDRLSEVFGDADASTDLFAAAVVSYALRPGAVYDFDYRNTAELIEKKFGGTEFGDALRSVFYEMCRFKERNEAGLMSCLSDGNGLKAANEKKREADRKAGDFRKTVSKAYQVNNPFLEIITKAGFDEFYGLLEKFIEAEDIGTVYGEISGFLSENGLVREDRKEGGLIPDMGGIDAYKDRMWNMCSDDSNLKKRYSNINRMNDSGKSKNVNRLYKAGVSILIECMEAAEEIMLHDADGYEEAKREAPSVIRSLKELEGNGYRAVDYIADRFIGMLEEA